MNESARSHSSKAGVRLTGKGAIAQNGGTAFGAHSAQVNGNIQGNLITGTQIVHQYLGGGPKELDGEAIEEQITLYLRWLRERTQHITLRGIERSGGAPVVQLPIETAYVPLRARAPWSSWNDLWYWSEAEVFRSYHSETKTLIQAVGIAGIASFFQKGAKLNSVSSFLGPDILTPEKRKALREHFNRIRSDDRKDADIDVDLGNLLGMWRRLVVIGGPGSGKTTVLLHLAWALATTLLGVMDRPKSDQFGLQVTPTELPLPIFVSLASFARYRRSLSGNAAPQEETLQHYISHYLISQQAGFRLPQDFFERLLNDGQQVLLLLDGLDEVANETERYSVRQQVEMLVHGKEKLRVVVTCRSVAYRQGRTALGASFREVEVQPLDHELHIVPMVQQAFACINPNDPALRDKRATSLLDGIRKLEVDRQARGGRDRDLDPLVGSPLMVRLLIIVHVNQRVLPNQRADLFDKAIEALLQVDYGHDEEDIAELGAQWETLLDMAQHLAWHLHSQGEEQGREIDEASLKASLRLVPEFAGYSDSFIAHARHRGSLIEERDGSYRFIHLALQEFLVARHLREVVAGTEGLGALVDAMRDKLTDPWWREPILLAMGYRSGRASRQVRELIGQVSKLSECLCTDHDRALAAAELAGTAAADWPDSGAKLRHDCAKQLNAVLGYEATLLQIAPARRVLAGDALSRLGDERFDTQRLFLPVGGHLGFVHVPADANFMIGTRQTNVDLVAEATGMKPTHHELNEKITPSPAFYIACYPVTVAQFRAFVDATGVRIRSTDGLRDFHTRPITGVNWHEATKYCSWLQQMLSNSPLLADTIAAGLVREHGYSVALPSELEWEKAARGGKVGLVYPWGNKQELERANCGETGVGSTSAVGCFAPNDYGLYDMVGNVWEWTRSYWTERYNDERPAPGSSTPSKWQEMIVRGGSWQDSNCVARCAYRFGFVPDGDDPHQKLGFRVVLTSTFTS